MRKHKNLILFIAITFFWSVFVSMLKFFLWGYLKDLHISLEEIMGYIALGCMFSYFIGGSLAYFFREKSIIIFVTLGAIVTLSIAQVLGYCPFPVFVIAMSVIGFMYGLWLIIKSILLTVEIQKSEFTETAVNGTVNIAILGGTILGSYLGFTIFSLWQANGFWALVGLLVLALFATLFLSSNPLFQKKSFVSSFFTAFPSIWKIIKKYIWLLIPVGTLWAISAAIGQKMLELGVDVFNKVPKSSILIIVVSIAGAIVGHIISAFITKNKRWLSMIFTVVLGLGTFYFPYIINRYDYYITLNISSFLMGVFFGIAVNLLEGRFYFHIGEDQRKEYGAAAYGIATNIIIFVIMLCSDILTKQFNIIVPFMFFGVALLLMPLFIRRFK